MFVFEDIKSLNDVALQEILKKPTKSSHLALKGTDDEMQERFFRNMSKRAVETMKEEMEYMGPIKLKEVEKAQHEIVSIVRELEEEGIVSIGGGDEEQYV